MSKKPPIYIEATEHDSHALLLGNNLPFLTGVIKQLLLDAGCQAHTSPKRHILYDYLIVFGAPPSINNGFRHLKPGGKAVFVVTDNHRVESNASGFPVVSVTTATQFSADKLAHTILEKMFTAQPTFIREDTPQKHPKPNLLLSKLLTGSFSTVSVNIAHIRHRIYSILRIALIPATLVCILMLPFLIFFSSVYYAITQLHTLTDIEYSTLERQQSVSHAQNSIRVATRVYAGFRPILAVISPKTASAGADGLTALSATAYAANELVNLEVFVKESNLSFTEKNPALFSSIIPETQRHIVTARQYLQSAFASIDRILPYSFPKRDTLLNTVENLKTLDTILEKIEFAIPILPDILAQNTEHTYLILLQNNFELRPTGGFIGSYATLKIADGVLENLDVQDVYSADGQLKGKVDPPPPIAKYLNQPNWFLRDSNWNPDFAISATQAEWFLNKEIGAQYHGVIAIDLYFIRSILHTLNGVYVPDYQQTVQADDFFLKLQTDTHATFFPGSTKKRDLITALASALMIELADRKTLPFQLLAKALGTSLEEKHILLSLHNPANQQIIDQLGWGGRIVESAQQSTDLSPYRSDYIMVVDANLGVNKVNYYIHRELYATIHAQDTHIENELVVYYKNNSPYRMSFFSGTYQNYVRVLIPVDSTVTEILVNNKLREDDVTTEAVADKKSIGFFISVEPQDETRIVIRYSIPAPESDAYQYQLMVQKQPGTEADTFVFKIHDDPVWKPSFVSTPSLPYLVYLRKDTLISVDFERSVEYNK